MSDPTLTLLYEFARRQTLAASRGFGLILSMVRALNTASRVNAQGLLETNLAANSPRFDHDPASKVPLGLLREVARTNLALQSGDLVSAPWNNIQTPALVANDAISPRGLLEVTLITDNSATNREGRQQSIAVPNNSATHATSIFVKKTAGGTSPTFGLEMVYAGGTGTVPVQIRLNTDTGETNGEGGGGTQAQDFGDYWRLWGLSTNNNTGNTTLLVKVLPALAAHGSFVDVASTQGSAHAWGLQAELGSILTSYIETLAATVIRNADVITTTDFTWLNPLEGTLFTDSVTPTIPDPAGGGTLAIASLSDGSNNNRIIHTFDTEPGVLDSFVFMTGLGGANFNLNDTALNLVKGDRLRIASSWKDTTLAASSNGNPVLTNTGVTIPQGLNKLSLASTSDTVQSNGHLRELRYYNIRKSSQFLQSLALGHISNNPLDFSRPLVRDLVQPPFRRL